MDYLQIVTDGPKDLQTNFVSPSYNLEISKRTPDYLNVYTVELFAMLMAKQVISTKILICSDSVSALTSIKAGTSSYHQDMHYELLFAISRIVSQWENITFRQIDKRSDEKRNCRN